MRTYPSSDGSGKMAPSAAPPSMASRPAPGVPITPGASSFRARHALIWFGFFAAVWLAGASGCTMLDL